MELWHKLLTYRKKNDQTKLQKSSAEKSESSCSFFGERAPFSLEKDAIRVLLFRECDQRGRKLLYDSKTVVRVPIAESASSGMPSCKTIFKSSKYSGSFITSSSSGAGSSSAPTTHPTPKKSSSGHIKSASTSSSKSDVFAEINGGYGYQYLQAENDTKHLGEFVFGTVALAYRGSCSKLHILQNPQRLLLSRSSPAPRSYLRPSCTSSDQGIEDSSFSSSLSSLSEAVISHTESLDMPYMHGIHSNIGPTWGIDMPHMLSTSHSEGDSGFGGPPSPYGSTCGSFLSPPSLPNTPLGTPSSRQGSGSSLKHSGSLNSLQRRFLRNVTTSLEALGREGEMNEDSVTSSGHHSHRTTRLGLAVIIDIGGGYAEMNRQVEDWFFLHLSVIEASLNKLQSSLDAAYLHPRTFASTTHQAVSQLQKDIMDLVSGPRLCRPVWLGLLGRSSSAERQMLCNHFVDTLASVLASFDTKHTNFFVSKLLTAVLTHHLGWVSTVVPGDYLPLSPRLASSTRNGSCGISSQSSATEDSSAYQATWVERLNESHPYSAVWAQLCELSGAVGYPPKAARTILVGSNSALLTQLLTILSYVIRCSQITEQDMQSYRVGESPSPEHQQPCFSRTSSVASVVTIVEGGQKDGQSQIRHSSSAKLHRDSSIRRSWRLNRENRNSRFSPLECRTNSGDSTAEMVAGVKGLNASDEQIGSVVERGSKIQAESLPPTHSSNKKDKEVSSSKWMLNDDVEIIINREKCAETFSTKIKRETGTSVDVEKSLSTCKTSTNLALLVDDCEASPNESYPVYCGNHQLKTFHEPFSERLYPSLHDLDDHKETFGAVSLEPDVISEKVQKLFRPSKCNVSQECKAFDEQITQLPSIAVSLVPDENGFKDTVLPMKDSTINPAHSNRADASNTGFLNGDICASCSFRATSVSDNSQNLNGIVHVNPSSSDTICEKKSSSRIIPAKNIKPEIEEGGKVLFLLGDNERIEGLKKHSKGSLLQPDSIEPSWISLGQHNTPVIGFEKFDNLAKLDQTNRPSENAVTLPVEPVYTQITSLPSPSDVRKIVRTRNVGRESALDLTSFERENVIYPSLSELKLSAKSGNSSLLKERKEIFTKTHRRRHSDPTNGDCTVKAPLCFSRSLKGVLEEQAADIKALSEVKEGAVGSECTLEKVLECLDNTMKEETSSPIEVIPTFVCEKNLDSHMKDNTISKNISSSDDEPVVLQMPRISCGLRQQQTVTNNGSGSISSSSLASSLLGGVLDHYSSVFVLHATTQVNQWEDVLRQDLYAASHHSTLDPQVSEAVAVVADTDSWEVQVVSSHSFIVERTGCGNQIGLRVGMSPLVSAITDSVLDLARLSVDPQFILQHLEERLCELYLKSQLLAEYLLGGAACGFGGSEASFSPYHLPELTRALGLDLNDLPLLLAVASTHTPALTRMFGITIK
ncbi:uncharacterized protein LOC135224626 [Macrobrachium nipponense]|uniref:uncharacterized protein LOC135224626 n=1 Tax=Macrobrachium nipponense TaxID=159736 RepID=UPI0030C7AF2A